MLAVVPEVLSHGAARVGSQVLQRGSVRGRSRHHNGVFHGISISQPLDQLSHGGTLLSNSYINAVQFLLLVCGVVKTLLVDYGVDGDSGFPEG